MKQLNNSKLVWILVVSIVFLGVMTSGNLGYAQEKLIDIQGHWAEVQIKKWVDSGLVKGYLDGTFKPNDNITRAEFITLVNKVIKLDKQTNIYFKDVKSTDWYASEIKKAIASGYISGYEDNTMKPNNPITRQEAAIVILNLLKFDEASNSKILNKFEDKDEIANWSKAAVETIVEKGYMSGYPDGTHKPTNPITRAESIAMLDKVMGQIYSDNGTYGPKKGMNEIYGNVTITAENITLKNTKITGNLYLAEGIGNGEVTLDNVVILGDTIIKGGGENSIIFNNTTLGDVIVFKVNGRIRVVAKGDTKIEKTIMKSGAKLQEDGVKGEGFEQIEVFTVGAGEKLELDGNFENITIQSKIEVAVTEKTVIKKLKVEESAEGSKIDLEKGITIENMTIEGKSEVEGKGTIEKATVSAEGTSFETAPKKSTINKGIDIKIAGKKLTGTGKTISGRSSSKSKSSSGGGSSSGRDTTKPVITLKGNKTVNVANGTTYVDEGVTVTDNKDTGLTAIVTYKKDGKVVNSINTSVAGTYIIMYNAKDSAGNSAIQVTRTVVVAPDENQEIINFPDKNLETLIRKKISKPTGDIYKSDVENITKLEALSHGIKNIKGIENLKNLQRLFIGDNQISDISALESLTNLQYLDLSYTEISDISALESLKNLESLRLYSTEISDISALESLKNLRNLDFSSTEVSDVSALESLTNLQWLDLSSTEISDISALESLTNLQRLYLHFTKISDISALESLKNLRNLDLSSTKISDISALENLKNLESLYLDSTEISDISALESLKNLRYLSLSYTEISDISALESLKNLQNLWLENNEISDISSLKNLTNLTILYLSGNPITDFSPVAGYYDNLEEKDFELSTGNNPNQAINFPDKNLEAVIREKISKPTGDIYKSDVENITELEVQYLGISNLEGIQNLTKLETLWMNGNEISDIRVLENLTNLKELSLYSNKIDNINPLDNLTGLKRLYLDGNEISDITPLKNITSLKELYINDNEIRDINPLENLTNLEDLAISHNEISDISPLENLVSLKGLYMQVNYISDIRLLENLTVLEELSISGNEINDIGALEYLTSLKMLFCNGSSINDISELKNLSDLERLDLGNNEISNIDVLDNLTNLESLNLANNEISDISVLSNLTNLIELCLAGNLITDYSPTAEYYGNLEYKDFELSTGNNPNQAINFPDKNLEAVIREKISKPTGDIYKSDVESITELEADERNIVRIDGIENLTNLVELSIGENKITSIEKLRNLHKLKELSLYANRVSDISALKDLTNLIDLDLQYNEVVDIEILENLTQLNRLDLEDNKISDISVLRNLTNLTFLDLARCGLRSVNDLSNLTNLVRLDLHVNEINDITPLKNLTNLTKLYLSENPITDFSPVAEYYDNLEEKDFKLP